MSWSVRLFKHEYTNKDGSKEATYDFREHFVDSEANMATSVAVPVRGESLKEIIWYIKKTVEAISKPVMAFIDDVPQEVEPGTELIFWKDVLNADIEGGRILYLEDAEDVMIKCGYTYVAYKGVLYKRVGFSRFEKTDYKIEDVL